MKAVRPILLEILPDDNTDVLFGEMSVQLAQIKGNSESPKITYILRKKDEGQRAVLKISASSQRAGKDSKEVIIQ